MYVANRTPAILDDRLSADFYAPIYIEIETKINNCGIEPIRLGAKLERVFKGAFYLLSSEYVEAGIPFIRVTQITGGAVDLNATVYISPAAHHRERKTAVHPGNLLFAKGGAYRHCAVVPSTSLEANISQDLIGAVTSSDLDSHYAFAFLASRFGRPQLIRWEQGDAQPHLSNDSVKHILLPFAKAIAQKYIGNKVRQAELLRTFEAALKREIATLFCLPSWNGHRAGAMKTYRSLVGNMSEERLDAPHYDPAHLHLRQVLKRQRSRPLSMVCEGVDERWRRNEAEFFYLEIGEIDLGAGRVAPQRLPASDAPSRAQRLVKPWDVLVATVRPNRKNVAIVSEVSDNLPIVASTGFSVLRFQSNEAAAFYHSWLRCDAATQQLVQWNAGGTYPAIEEDIPRRILVPPFSDDTVSETGRKCMTQLVAGDFAGKLCDSAKLLVESLIEGRIAEDELVDAQQALERGDQTLDRAILSRLTEDGIDVVARPRLFADLDALYAAIDEAQRTEPSNGDTA